MEYKNQIMSSLTVDTKCKVIETLGPNLSLVEYSAKSVAVIGDTKPHKDTLKELGGKWNSRLKCGPGWIYPKTKIEDITKKMKGTGSSSPKLVKQKPSSPPIMNQWDVNLRKTMQKSEATEKRIKMLENQVLVLTECISALLGEEEEFDDLLIFDEDVDRMEKFQAMKKDHDKKVWSKILPKKAAVVKTAKAATTPPDEDKKPSKKLLSGKVNH